MVLGFYGVMRKMDPSYLRGGESRGARPSGAFRHVFLPLSLPGVVNGCILVFTMCLGFYITPILLGTPKDMMISQLISQQIEDAALGLCLGDRGRPAGVAALAAPRLKSLCRLRSAGARRGCCPSVRLPVGCRGA